MSTHYFNQASAGIIAVGLTVRTVTWKLGRDTVKLYILEI